MRGSEQNGGKFKLETFLKARKLCQDVVAALAKKVEAGFTEKDGQALITAEFAKIGVSKFWHPSKFRVGSETTKTFRDLPNQSVALADNDLFFVDVGPVIDEHEADFGETFLFRNKKGSANRYSSLAEGARGIWSFTAEKWKSERLAGKELFQVAEEFSRSLGFQLNPQMAGHRLGDFPHALFSKDRLFELDFSPSSNLWVLEIHIRSEQLNRGAFFEDILLP